MLEDFLNSFSLIIRPVSALSDFLEYDRFDLINSGRSDEDLAGTETPGLQNSINKVIIFLSRKSRVNVSIVLNEGLFRDETTLLMSAHAVNEFQNVAVLVAYIGACTGAKLDDLRAAAQVFKGKRVAQGVRLMVAPASLTDQSQAEQEGVMSVLRDAGAEVLPTACGACSGYGGSIPDGANVIATTARNFKGRMGSATAQVYLASPYTVAASALRGFISDPREVLA
jgi:homoaconitase/3-isopropylmalate dehydratase large subunit